MHAQVLSPDTALVNRDLVTDAHGRGLPVLPWTPDDLPEMNRLIDAGVDGIITDYPDRLRQVMAERGMPLPRPYPAGR
ncbi:glycerophosphodiester phosphodiesterase [Saccharopolyspora rosea]|uniref:Glycerophosphodiester phosphodiesterase n=1 Tax=Saccharopolyspora rosea TaxID=524884 RepID=A0ABW3FV23_9PSEU|nr:glycerophosphodiester phosphodiesterase family protein [Saccharopolyspora rosea]